MENARTIKFKDLDTNDEALVIIRYDNTGVCLSLSHKSDGDIQVVMEKEVVRQVLSELEIAVKNMAQ